MTKPLPISLSQTHRHRQHKQIRSMSSTAKKMPSDHTAVQTEETSHRPRRRSIQAREPRPVAVVNGASSSSSTSRECTTPKDINECADDFIKRFRQQLQLQRLESLENYRQMLERGL